MLLFAAPLLLSLPLPLLPRALPCHCCHCCYCCYWYSCHGSSAVCLSCLYPRPLPPRLLQMVWTWLVQLADALHFLHSHRVLHRDLKPANVFIRRGSHGLRAKLGDFGLAKSLTSMSRMAHSTVCVRVCV
jgi:serine/threonine protein kinase